MGDIPPPDPSQASATLRVVMDSAARLQEVVPGAVLVGGTAAALYAGHRDSFDHDHVVADLADRYEQVLEAVEATEGWATSVRASRPPMTIMGSLGGIEAGLRQLRRTVPLEVQEIEIAPDVVVQLPTAAETLRVKTYLVVQRNVTRDYLDVAALADRYGVAWAAQVLADLDRYYVDRSGEPSSVASAAAERLADPRPRDTTVTHQLGSYKNLAARWHRWENVREQCQELALVMTLGGGR